MSRSVNGRRHYRSADGLLVDLCRVEAILTSAGQRADGLDAIDPAILRLIHRQHCILTELDRRERLLRLAIRWAEVTRSPEDDAVPDSNVVALFPHAESWS